MYVVLITSKLLAPFTDLMPVINKEFAAEKFSIWGSEDKGYQFRIEGVGDEKLPRKFAQAFVKTWKPSPIAICEHKLERKFCKDCFEKLGEVSK